MVKEIYKLSQNLVDPRYNGFRFKRGTKSLTGRKNRELDFDPDDGRKFGWKPQKLKKLWEAPELVGPVPSFHDYPCVGSIPCFSKKSVNALQDLLLPSGELLPANTEQGVFYLYNILAVTDAFVPESSDMIMLRTGLAAGVNFYFFDKNATDGLTVFRIRYRPPEVFVTDEFKKRVEDANLNGFLFEKVWPFKRGIDWREKAGEVRQKIRNQSEKLRGESIYIDFYYPDGGLASKSRIQLEKLADSIEMLLSDEMKSNGEYLGTLEMADDCGEYSRFYVSCPSIKKIQTKLTSWVASRKWPYTCAITFRLGHLHEIKVKERRVELP